MFLDRERRMGLYAFVEVGSEESLVYGTPELRCNNRHSRTAAAQRRCVNSTLGEEKKHTHHGAAAPPLQSEISLGAPFKTACAMMIIL